jgi:hypothetical protein
MPASIAYSPDALKKSISSLVGRLGCPTCFSGANCLFQFERDYVFDARGNLSDQVALNPQPLPPRADSTVHVSLSSGNRFDIEKIFKAVDSVINLIGPCPCHSGFDVNYLNELKVIGVNERGEAQQFGG